jgi:hypothetical protein
MIPISLTGRAAYPGQENAGAEPAKNNAAAPVDFAYWHEVFDQVHGSIKNDGRGTSNARDQADGQPPQPLRVVQADDAPHRTSSADRQINSSASLSTSLAMSAWSTQGAESHEPSQVRVASSKMEAGRLSAANGDSGALTGAAESGNQWAGATEASVQAQRRRHLVKSSPPEQPLAAHLLRTATGDLHVVLRAHQELSVGQALGAVAQAMNNEPEMHGRVTQVMLNGHRIYQADRQPEAVAAVISKFELNC